ncbi:MAG: phage holin, LLH family [Peptococcales bacterium]|jgi:hypothetical protein
MKKYLFILLTMLLMITAPVAIAEAVDAAPAQPFPAIDLTPLFQAIIAVLATLITSKLIPWIKARTNERQQALIRAAVTTAVYAAEQIYGASNGKEKLMYVKSKLAKKGYRVDIDEIEAAVQELTLNQGNAYGVVLGDVVSSDYEDEEAQEENE